MGWSAFRKTGLTHHNPNLSVKGYTLFAQSGGDEVHLLDMAGSVVGYWKFEDMNVAQAQLTPAGTILVAGTKKNIAQAARELADDDYSDIDLHTCRLGGGFHNLREIDFSGNVLWSYNNPRMHHDFLLKQNGNLLIPVWAEIDPDIAGAIRGGERKRGKKRPPMLGDDIIEVDRNGTERSRLQTWRIFDPRKHPIRPLLRRAEWTHTNSLALAQDGKLLVSCRNTSVVALIDPIDATIDWEVKSPVVSHQHHATFVPNGNIQIFDNGMNRPHSLPYSRVIEIERTRNEVVWEYQAETPAQFFSGHISSAQRLANGNVLICEGTSGRLFEITRSKQIVWEWITPIVNGTPDGELFTWIYRAARYPLDHPAIQRNDLNPRKYRTLNENLGLAC